MRVLVAMSGGVDSSVAAALLLEEGHDVVGVTLKLWGGAQDSGCCSVGDVEDARRVAQQLGVDHHVFNFSEDFHERVVLPYVVAHGGGDTPNPCVECNRHVKFDRLIGRARQLGFDAVATGHHARIEGDGARRRLLRGADRTKDQSYVLHMLRQDQLARLRFPVGCMTKAQVRQRAAELRLRTAAKPDSQDTCFITASGGRAAFLGERIALHPGRLVDADTNDVVGTVPAIELVTVGQRRGLGSAGAARRYAVDVDLRSATVTVGGPRHLLRDGVGVTKWSWVDEDVPVATAVMGQTSAHGAAMAAVRTADGLRWLEPQRRVASGQAVVVYDGDTGTEVLGGGSAV